MKKVISFILILALAAGMMIGCGKSEEGAADNTVVKETDSEEGTDAAEEAVQETPGEKKKLIWFTEQMDDSQYAKWMEYVVTPFNESHPDIEVEISATADYEQVLKVQLAANGGPDICNMGGPTITSEYVEGDKILDLTEYVENAGLDKKIFKGALDSCKVNGKIYSVPNSYEALMLWYNVDMFEENGWKVPETYEELKTVCEDAQDKGIIPIAFGTSDFKAINEQFVGVALCAYAGRENVKKALNGEMKWTDPVFQEAITTLNDMWQAGWINDKKSHAISQDDGYSLFYNQSAAMAMTGTWSLGTFAEQIQDFKYGAVAFPSLKDGVPPTLCMGAGGVIAINANTKYPDECFEFINFLFNNDELQAQAVSNGLQPLPYDMDESLYSSDMNEVDKEVLSTLENSQSNLESAGFVMWTYWPAETRQYMMDNIENVYLGNLTVEDYLEKTQSIFEKEFESGKLIPVS